MEPSPRQLSLAMPLPAAAGLRAPPHIGWSHFISTFRFEPGVTPLSSLPIPLLTCATYLLVIFTLKRIINDKKKAVELSKVRAA